MGLGSGRYRFPLSSDLLELLIAFEECEGLNQLAEKMAKDPSVVSRRLQQIAESYPLLTKVKGRWELTPLGRETNRISIETTRRYEELLRSAKSSHSLSPWLAADSALLVINAQIGLLDGTQEGRNNSQAETNIARLLKKWRASEFPVLHVRHVSENQRSPFFRGSNGVEFLPELKPTLGEITIEKTSSSAFKDTALADKLRELQVNRLVITGFTTNDCIDSTVRDAAALSFSNAVVSDATAMFDLRDPNGKLVKAERLQRLTMANIGALFAQVILTNDIVRGS